jgi:hypothetical protein
MHLGFIITSIIARNIAVSEFDEPAFFFSMGKKFVNQVFG